MAFLTFNSEGELTKLESSRDFKVSAGPVIPRWFLERVSVTGIQTVISRDRGMILLRVSMVMDLRWYMGNS